MQHDLALEQMVLFPTRGQNTLDCSLYSPSGLLGGLLAADMMTAFPWISFTLMPMNSVVLPMCTIEPTSERLQAMSTPPCGSLPLSRRKTSKGEYIEQLVKDITTIRSQYQSSYFILGGDFNLPDIDWESSTVKGHQLPRRVTIPPIASNYKLHLV
jgi:hypothetical protein